MEEQIEETIWRKCLFACVLYTENVLINWPKKKKTEWEEEYGWDYSKPVKDITTKQNLLTNLKKISSANLAALINLKWARLVFQKEAAVEVAKTSAQPKKDAV
jgi:hypothetical protein